MSKKLKLLPILTDDVVEIRDIMVKIVEDEGLRWFKNGEKPFVQGYNFIGMQKYHT